jgi:dTDP-glucose 4,6-dehydratase
MTFGKQGEQYCIGGGTQKANITLAGEIIKIMGKNPSDLIEFVEDRKGHDFRYDIDSSKIQKHIGWKPQVDFDTGLRKTIEWYCNNMEWVQSCKRSPSA